MMQSGCTDRTPGNAVYSGEYGDNIFRWLRGARE
jgi:hypothetical protein